MRIRGDVRHANTHPFGSETDGMGPLWDDWDDDDEVVDPTPSQRWQPDIDDPLQSDLDAESLVWASSAEPSADPDPPAASV
jgi:hypothetical protein